METISHLFLMRQKWWIYSEPVEKPGIWLFWNILRPISGWFLSRSKLPEFAIWTFSTVSAEIEICDNACHLKPGRSSSATSSRLEARLCGSWSTLYWSLPARCPRHIRSPSGGRCVLGVFINSVTITLLLPIVQSPWRCWTWSLQRAARSRP